MLIVVSSGCGSPYLQVSFSGCTQLAMSSGCLGLLLPDCMAMEQFSNELRTCLKSVKCPSVFTFDSMWLDFTSFALMYKEPSNII